MKWVEIIKVRSVNMKMEVLESLLQSLINEINQEMVKNKVKIFSHITLETDFSIHLLHESKKSKMETGPIGMRLVFVLKEFGIVTLKIM